MAEQDTFSLTLEQSQNYEFMTHFEGEGPPPLLINEPEPLSSRQGPNASQLLGAAVGYCLSASLLFCLQKARLEVAGINTTVTGTYRRNERGRKRIGKLDVGIVLDLKNDQPQRRQRCLDIFEDYCVVTASVRKGIEITVTVTDPQGNSLQ